MGAALILGRGIASDDAASASLMLRRARTDDQASIVRMVHAERLNPNALHWPNFIVAECGGRIVGAVQLRAHADGSRELGSLVVDSAYRCRGIAARLISTLLSWEHRAPAVHVITRRELAAYFARWGFRVIAPRIAPRAVRSNHRMGQLIGGLMSLLRGRAPRRLVVLERA
jgi:amino-acid N-acetyltransferase